ncbi:MAG: rpoE 4 [Verrucomicrobia bacterium]|jgi:RNA polymerase sigma-70 factor (ECF subfamily)|nr:rpoE 4 [Verrucomicrobiota bacterium]
MNSPVKTGEIDEAALVRAVQSGEVKAFEPLVDAHLDHLRAFIALKLPVTHLVNEIAHETFVFAFRNIRHFEAGTSFWAWLRAIAGNLTRAELQRFRREQVNQLGYARHRLLEAGLAQASSSESDEVEHLRRCVEELPDHMRTLVTLKYRQDLSIEQIATQLSRTQTAVWQALFRLRQQLKLCIENKLAKSRG